MNWDRVEGSWKQLIGGSRQRWGKLTGDQLDVAAGIRDSLAGRMQAAYGISKDETEKQLAEWRKRMKTNAKLG
jgi:uncharacterized protein YjbJ (UPF0337 family)